MHCLDAFIVTTGKFICAKNIFGVVISNLQQTIIFTFLCFFGVNTLGNLYIQFVILACCDKINFVSPL